MDNLDFSEDEIQEQLAILGYKNIPEHRLREFKKDLDERIQHGDLKNLAAPAQINPTASLTAESQPSPPAYTKEKVSQHEMQDSTVGLYLPYRQGPSTSHTIGHQRQQGSSDSYAQHSVAPTQRLHIAGAPSRLRVEPDPDNILHPPLTDSYTSSPDTHGRRFMKRKVLRRHEGQSFVCDESVYSEDSAAGSCLEERLADLHLFTEAQRDYEAENDNTMSESNTQSSESICVSAFESYIRGMSRTQCVIRSKSFIRPVMSQQTVKKTDPVAKYFQYKQLWKMFKLPGEKDNRAVRLEIRERLAYQPPPPKPRRVYVPNTYVVPTEKKRSALRWEIRNDLANGLIPYKYTHRF